MLTRNDARLGGVGTEPCALAAGHDDHRELSLGDEGVAEVLPPDVLQLRDRLNYAVQKKRRQQLIKVRVRCWGLGCSIMHAYGKS